jgi:hypothetical protein
MPRSGQQAVSSMSKSNGRQFARRLYGRQYNAKDRSLRRRLHNPMQVLPKAAIF